jgi:nucleotide-binding universal stress UspA family protein
MTSEQSDTALEDRKPLSTPPATGVVVGVDDSQAARAAVAWAAVAADRRGVGLDLVEVVPGGADAAHGRARALLSRAQGIARSVCPALDIRMHTLHGKVAPALVEHAAHAALLVVGSNGPGGPIPLSLGSIVGGVTRQCPCPVVLVPAGSPTSNAQDGPVVVALEDTPDGRRALAFAADAAHHRDVPLAPLVADANESALLGALRERYPDLVVESQTITERPAEALLHAGTEAQLIVVPSVGRRPGRSSATSGWTGHFLPILSACPVAVVSTRTLSSTTLA